MTPVHHDEALAAGEALLLEAEHDAPGRIVLVDDLFGRMRLLVEVPREKKRPPRRLEGLARRIAEAAGPYWSEDGLWLFDDRDGSPERELFEQAWREGAPVRRGDGLPSERVRVCTRVRDHSGWFAPPTRPPWPTWGHPGSDAGAIRAKGPPIVAFLSYKGGVGRTTALASFAIQRARLGESVVVVDLDLDAPGVGVLFDDDPPGTTATHGVVDYLLEQPILGAESVIEDYVHRCRRIARDGSIVVMPAGRMSAAYLGALGRVDLELVPGERQPLRDLLLALRTLKPSPDWILLDGRAGLSEVAGVLSSGVAHLHVLLATASAQGFAGLERFVHRLGAERLHAPGDLAQGELIVAQTMATARSRAESVARFAERTREIVIDHYLLRERDPEDRLWCLDDVDDPESPAAHVTLGYREEFAYFQRIDEVADRLAADPDYVDLAGRIERRFPGRRRR